MIFLHFLTKTSHPATTVILTSKNLKNIPPKFTIVTIAIIILESIPT